MKTIANVALLVCLLALPTLTCAQTDAFGAPDTVYAEVAKVDNGTWTITVSCFNDEPLVGISVPIKMAAGMNKIVADSAVYTGGRVVEANFNTARYRADTAIQCVTLGMLANIGPTDNQLAPGKGRLATIYVSSIEDKPIESLTIDTTTTDRNTLMMIAHDSQVASVAVDSNTTPHKKFEMRLITPVWRVTTVE